MKAQQLHLPHTCLANCCSGHCASLGGGGEWELIEARIVIPAPCWVGQGISMTLEAAWVQVFVELKLEHIPIPLGYADPLTALCPRQSQDPVEAEELILVIKGDLWVISFSQR